MTTAIRTRTDYATSTKGVIRAEQLDIPKSVTALMLPGIEALDVKHCLAAGTFSRETLNLCAVERNAEYAALMHRELESLGIVNNIQACTAELCDLRLRSVFPDGSLDFAYLDFTGTLKRDLCEWLRDHLARALHTGSVVSFTFIRNYRGNRFVPRLRDSGIFAGTALLQDTAAQCGDILPDINKIISCFRACLAPCRLSIPYYMEYTNPGDNLTVDGEIDGRGSHMAAVRFVVEDANDPAAIPESIITRLEELLLTC